MFVSTETQTPRDVIRRDSLLTTKAIVRSSDYVTILPRAVAAAELNIVVLLAAAGYSAFILKYRPMPTRRDPVAYMTDMAAQFGKLGKSDLADYPPAVDDLAAAIRLLSADAGKWKIDPAQIGAIGFSAGSRTAIRLIEQRPEAKQLRHFGLIYPPMLRPVAGGPRAPLFLAIASDDPLFKQGGLTLVDAWLKESAKTEFHLYSGGSHGFGMRPMGTTSDNWIDQYLAWLGKQ